MKVLHIINDLNRGGAEMALVRLARWQREQGDEVAVICLLSGGELAAGLAAHGVSVTAFGLKSGPGLPTALLRLGRTVRAERPDIIQTWLYHSNLIGGVASRLARPRTPVVWGIHHSILKRESSRRTTMLVSYVSALLSRLVPRRIVYCARLSRQTHEAGGYAPARGIVIPNGISTATFAPNDAARETVRAELGLPLDTALVGIVARNHPDKDIPTFLVAAGILADDAPASHFVLAGRGLDGSDAKLNAVIPAALRPRFHFLGPRDDVPRLLAAFDLATLSSRTEAFPISIIEAMASGTPFVSTDVGDAREVIAATGRVVPVNDPAALAAAWQELLDLPGPERRALGSTARARVQEHYELDRIARRYRAVYAHLCRC